MPTSMPPTSGSSRSPLPSASVPRTSWKYCGIANSRPNIANDTSVTKMVPQRKPGELNSPRSTSGTEPRAVTRRSHRTNSARTATPATSVASATASLQPSWPALMSP